MYQVVDRCAMPRRGVREGLPVLLLLLCTVLLPWQARADTGQYVIPYKDASGKQVGSFTYKESHALLIGISNYRIDSGWSQLPGVKDDIKAVKLALEKQGFSVKVVEDPDQAELERAYSNFLLEYGGDLDNRLLFYFAGHGYTIKPQDKPDDEGRWLGVVVSRDAPRPDPNRGGNERAFRSQVLTMERIASMANEITARHALFLFDSCFSGARGFNIMIPSPEDFAVTKDTGRSVRQFISSGTAGQKVLDKSYFRRGFVDALNGEADTNNDGYITGSELGLFLQGYVLRTPARTLQTPQFGKIVDPDLSRGDFVFPLKSAARTCAMSTPPAHLKSSWEDNLGMEFVLVPAAEFTMGAEGNRTVRPPHQVKIESPFYLGKYEVTQAQWTSVMGVNPSHFTGDPNLPVENVSWDEVQEFLRRLNAKEETTRYRLPTEAEWELAARACQGTVYSFGDDERQLGKYAWYDENAGKRTHAVGQLLRNGWGLFDMYGNVWEWCQDWYGEYPGKADTDPQGAAQGTFRVYRGGGWQRGESALYCQPASRHGARPGFRHPALGFRVAMSVAPTGGE